ncbi:MAG: ribonuclease HII [Oscillospiraceae bacterium]|nr:ribonuclease HII [Oscillospiraceae bacterium]
MSDGTRFTSEVLHEFDAAIRLEGHPVLCGVDEAGRGPLAGPVYAAAVILDPENLPEGLNDSKKLSIVKREKAFDSIREKALAYSIASAGVEEIENINILQATMLAMKRAVERLDFQADLVLIDGNKAPELTVPTRCLISGDTLSASIAAASILAKVSRDREMCLLDAQYPEYGFAQHKGYATKAHTQAIRQYGPCAIHRLSFLGKI